MIETDDNVIVIGKLGKPRGVRGEITIIPLTDFPERFLKMKTILVSSRNGSWETMNVESSMLVSGRPVMKLAGIHDPESAARMTNKELAVLKTNAVQLPKNRFYVFDIVGCQAVDESNGKVIGDVVDVMSAPANDVYHIRTSDGRMLLAAAVSSIVRSVDIANRTIVVNAGGLFEEQNADAKDEV
jgi:16S rRNA processing protein RimM